ncbi:MAG: TetR/AcrR family transcriptional regulator [Spirochaetales bacterium]|jgi:AcrR family transcriptional regulator|nr:TetR/AcrR family transcriptional regulator [Spirochaetales bacterium]
MIPLPQITRQGQPIVKKKDETQRKIIETFLSLYAKLPLKQITIKGITERLKINRGTFYLHYFDLDDLLTSIEDEHLEFIRKINDKNRRYYLSNKVNDLQKFYIPTLKHIEENKPVIRILMSPNSRPRFKDAFKDMMRNNVKSKYQFALDGNKRDEYKKYIIDIIIAGNMGIISNWVCTENNNSAQDIADLFGDILLNLPYFNVRS